MLGTLNGQRYPKITKTNTEVDLSRKGQATYSGFLGLQVQTPLLTASFLLKKDSEDLSIMDYSEDNSRQSRHQIWGELPSHSHQHDQKKLTSPSLESEFHLQILGKKHQIWMKFGITKPSRP